MLIASPAPETPTGPLPTVSVVVASAPLTTTPGASSRALTVFEVVVSLASSLTLAFVVPAGTAARLVT